MIPVRGLPRAAERAIEGLACAAILALVAHVWLPLPNPPGLWLETGISMLAWWSAERMERAPLLGAPGDLALAVEAMAVTILVAGPAFLLARRDGERAWRIRIRRAWLAFASVAVLPALLGLLATIAFAGSLAGGGALLLALAVSGAVPWLARARGAQAVRAGDLPRPLPEGRVAFALACLLGFASFLGLHALYISGPGLHPWPVGDALPRLLAPLLASLPDGPLVRGVARGIFVVLAVLLSVLAQARGLPLLPRLRAGPPGWAAPLLHLGLVGLLCALPVQVWDVWRCPDAGAGSPDRILARDSGAFQVAVMDGGRQLWANLRDDRRTLRLALPAGDPLPAVEWPVLRPTAWPEELIPLPGGGAWVGLVVPAAGDQTVLMPLDAEARPSGDPFTVPGCWVASWARLPDPGEILLGCEYAPAFVVMDTEARTILRRFVVPGMGSAEEIAVDPARGLVFAVPLWSGAWLAALDLRSSRVEASRFVGDFNWGVARGDDGRIFLSRFHEGRVVAFDTEDLSPAGSWEVDWSARPIVLAGGRWIVTAGTWRGRLRAVDVRGELGSRVLRTGGLVRSLALDPSGSALYWGGRCGIHRVDLDAWLGAAGGPG